jgi:hypothetical protein
LSLNDTTDAATMATPTPIDIATLRPPLSMLLRLRFDLACRFALSDAVRNERSREGEVQSAPKSPCFGRFRPHRTTAPRRRDSFRPHSFAPDRHSLPLLLHRTIAASRFCPECLRAKVARLDGLAVDGGS